MILNKVKWKPSSTWKRCLGGRSPLPLGSKAVHISWKRGIASSRSCLSIAFRVLDVYACMREREQ